MSHNSTNTHFFYYTSERETHTFRIRKESTKVAAAVMVAIEVIVVVVVAAIVVAVDDVAHRYAARYKKTQ
jgi:hypothetical protein